LKTVCSSFGLDLQVGREGGKEGGRRGGREEGRERGRKRVITKAVPPG